MKVRDVMIRDVVTSSGKISIEEAISTLHNRHVGSTVIVGKDGKCEGIFTERDAIRVIATGVPLTTPLKEVMTTDLVTVREASSFAEAKRLMKSHGIRHLPVVDEEEHLVGLVSLRSTLEELLGISAS